MKWEMSTIGQHCTVTSSKRFHLSDRCNYGIPFYCSKEIIQKVNGEIVTECDYIKEDAYESVKKQFGVPVCGDLLITTRGTYGVPYIYRDTDKFYFADGNLTWLKDFDNHLLVKFLYYWILSHEGQKKIDAIAKGTAQKAVPIATLKLIEIPLPPIETQKRIADILSAYDDLIENNQKQIKLLEEAAQRLYKEWFVDLRFPGHEHTAIVDGVPEGWRKSPIEKLCLKINAGGTPSRRKTDYWYPASINWYKTGELNDCWLIDSEEHISKNGLENSSAKLFPKNTIIMAIYASPTLGRLGIMSSESSCNQAALCFIADSRIISWQWLYYKLFELRDSFNAVAKGAGQQNISAETVKKTLVIVPSIKEIEIFTNIVEPLFEKMLKLTKQNVCIKESRDRLLPKLMSGEMEV